MRNVLAVALAAGLALLPAKASAQSAPVQEALSSASATHGPTYRFLSCLMRRESTYRWWVTSPNGLYHGGFQFDWQRWNEESPKYGFAGASPYNLWAAAHVAAGTIANYPLWRIHGIWPPSRYCGSPWA